MERSVEVTAKSVAEAKKVAMQKLGVEDESQVAVEVLEETKGLFNRTTARIRATVIDSAVVSVAPDIRHEEDRRVEPKGEPVAMGHPHEVAHEAGPSTEALLQASLEPAEADGEVTVTDDMITEAIALLQRIVDSANMKIDVTHAKTEGRYIHLNMTGPDVPYMIGKRGAVIDALQYLVNVIFSKDDDGSSPRLVLDGDSYRTKRAETLRGLALELANQVQERGEEAELEPLPAHERRIVHRVLLENQHVKTYSEGAEPDRRVIISPK